MHRIELARIKFSWHGSTSSGLDACAMEELVHIQKVITLLASEVWKAANPNRQRLPKGFQEATLFSVRTAEPRSMAISLERRALGLPALSDSGDPLSESFELLHATLAAANKSLPLPSTASHAAVSEIAKLGTHLPTGAEFQVQAPGRQYVPVLANTRDWLHTQLPTSRHETVTISGSVLEVDVRQKRCQVWNSDGKTVVEFTDEHEAQLLAALRDHDATTISVKGEGVLDTNGYRITKVSQITLNNTGAQTTNFENQDIHRMLKEIVKSVPDEAWESLPTDLSARHDHYIYGAD